MAWLCAWRFFICVEGLRREGRGFDPGSACVSRAGFGVSPKQSLEVRESETLPPTLETSALPSKSMKSATIIKGGRIIDPANGRDEVADLAIIDGRIGEIPESGERKPETEEIDASGLIV